jgi:spermidine/putrescine-binding protein
MSINKNSANPDAAAAFLDYLYSDDFYDRISKDWPGDWNLPLTSIDEAKLTKNVSPIFAKTFTAFSKAVAQGNYGYTTWTFWPPATEDYLIHGIEQVWLGQITTADYLKKMQEIFAKELVEGKVPATCAQMSDDPQIYKENFNIRRLHRFCGPVFATGAHYQWGDHPYSRTAHYRDGVLRLGRRNRAVLCWA